MTEYYAKRADENSPDIYSGCEKAGISCCPWKEYPVSPESFAQVCYSEKGLHVRLTAFEKCPRTTYFNANDPVYKDSCLELFICPLPCTGAFCDFELNSAGTLLLGHFSDGVFRLLDSSGLPDFSVKNSRSQDGESWSVELTVPFGFLENIFEGYDARKKDDIRVNFYKCGDETDVPHYACWSPVHSEKPDFFHPEDFGVMKFI